MWKSPKIEKSNLFIYFSLFFSMLKFFSCHSNKFFPGSFGRKRIGSGTLWNFSWPAANRNSKIGFPRQFFLPHEPEKWFPHSNKKFSHCQKRKKMNKVPQCSVAEALTNYFSFCPFFSSLDTLFSIFSYLDH